VLYGVNAADDGLSTIDPMSGATTFIGPLDPDPDRIVTPVRMTVSQTGQMLVRNNGDQPYGEGPGWFSVDRCTGLGTQVFAEAFPYNWLVFGPDGTLYGSGYWNGQAQTVVIDPTSGAPSPLGFSLPIGRKTFDPESGLMYIVRGVQDLPDLLVRYQLVVADISTGDWSEVGLLDKTEDDLGILGGLAFSPWGTLLASAYNGPLGGILFTINTSDASVADIVPVHPGFAPQGMAFGPPCEASP
jgi:hypothetical protein